jgi:hypothetical protein
MTDRVSTRAAMTRHVSTPALALLRQAGLSPGDIDHAIDALVRDKASAMLRKGHGLLRRIEAASGVAVVQIARRSRYLLITIEQAADGAPSWQYREVSPRQCRFSCPGQIPATAAMGLVGQSLRHLARPMTGMDELVIEQISDTPDGWLLVDVTPAWSVF